MESVGNGIPLKSPNDSGRDMRKRLERHQEMSNAVWPTEKEICDEHITPQEEQETGSVGSPKHLVSPHQLFSDEESDDGA